MEASIPPTSSRSAVAAAAAAGARGRTVVLITHRMASVREVDRIYVLDHGVLVEEGTHDELSAAGGLYAQPYALQATACQDGNVPDDQKLDHGL